MTEAVASRSGTERAVAWGLVGSIGYAGCQWGILLVTARLGTPEWVGLFSYATAVSAPIFMMTNMQLGSLQATDGAGAFRFADYWRHRFIFSLMGYAALLVGGAARLDPGLAGILALVGAAKVAESWSDVHHGRFQRGRRQDLVARSQLIRGIAGVGVVAAAIALTHRLWPAMLGLAMVWTATWYWHDRRVGEGVEPASLSGSGRVRALAGQAFPLGVAAMLVSANVSVPRLVLERFAGSHALGLFAAIAYLVVGGRMVALPFAQVYAPRLGDALAAGRGDEFRALLIRLLGIGLVLGVIGLFVAIGFGSQFLAAVYGPEYAGEQRAFVILMVAAGLGYLSIFLQVGVTAARAIGAQVPVVLLSIVATTVVAVLVVPTRKVEGAAWAMTAGAAVEFLGSLILALQADRRGPFPPALARQPVAARAIGTQGSSR